MRIRNGLPYSVSPTSSARRSTSAEVAGMVGASRRAVERHPPLHDHGHHARAGAGHRDPVRTQRVGERGGAVGPGLRGPARGPAARSACRSTGSTERTRSTRGHRSSPVRRCSRVRSQSSSTPAPAPAAVGGPAPPGRADPRARPTGRTRPGAPATTPAPRPPARRGRTAPAVAPHSRDGPQPEQPGSSAPRRVAAAATPATRISRPVGRVDPRTAEPRGPPTALRRITRLHMIPPIDVDCWPVLGCRRARDALADFRWCAPSAVLRSYWLLLVLAEYRAGGVEHRDHLRHVAGEVVVGLLETARAGSGCRASPRAAASWTGPDPR